MKCCIVLQRGWVMVCELTNTRLDSLFLQATHCATVRTWGTSEGLGELCRKGPLAGTKLDKETDQRIPIHSIVKGPMELDEKGWDEWFRKF